MSSEREAPPAPLLILGLGNPLLADDGVGLALLEGLRGSFAGDPRVELVDGGTQGLALLGLFTRRRALLLLDAVSRGAPPGTLHYSRDPLALAAPRAQGPRPAHAGSASELLGVAQMLGVLPPVVRLLGVEPAWMRTHYGLSHRVRGALPRARERALATVHELLARIARAPDPGASPCTS